MTTTATIVVLEDNTLLVKLSGLTRADSNTEVNSGVTVTATIYAHDDHDTVWADVTLSAVGTGGDWQAVIDAISGLAAGDFVDINWVADGGVSLRGSWWVNRVPVRQRSVFS